MGWLSFYDFFDQIGIDLGKAKLDFEKFRDLIRCGVYDMIQLDGLCVVCQFPKFVKRNQSNVMHSENGPAIEWADGYKLNYLNGVSFTEKLYKNVIDPKWPFSERMKIEDVDQRTQAINPKFADIDSFIKEANGVLLDEYNKFDIEGNEVNYKLYKFPQGDIFQEDAYYCYFDCPSTRKKHLEGVEVSKTVPEAMSWAEDISEEMWKLRVPLQHET
jgi:hypothetical protein